MGKLVYTLISSAYFVDEKWGFGSPHQGIATMGNIAHKERKRGKSKVTVPVTWLVNPKSAMIEKELLTGFHEEHGDIVGYKLNFDGHSIKRHPGLMVPGSKDELKAHVTREIGLIRDILPWADVQIVGTGYRSNSLVSTMEELGLTGLWGNCVFQIGTDGITDFGAPWGQWYVNPDNFKKPKRVMGKVISLEWTARDLNKAFHYGQAEAYSTDPNDAESQKKCTDENIEYWKELLNQYLQNTEHNDLVFFHQHQEAHEMEASPVCIPFTQERVDFTSKMLDLFLDHVVGLKDIEIVDANGSLKMFNAQNKGVQPPSYMYFEDIPIYQLSPEYKKVVENKEQRPKHVWLSFNEEFHEYIDNFVSQENWALKTPPWKNSFFYHDADCLLVFDKPKSKPVWICNYTDQEGRKFDDELMFGEETIPDARIDQKIDEFDEDIMQFIINVKSKKQMPYGIAIWGDFSHFKVENVIGIGSWKVIGNYLFFLRCTVNSGDNEYRINIKQV